MKTCQQVREQFAHKPTKKQLIESGDIKEPVPVQQFLASRSLTMMHDHLFPCPGVKRYSADTTNVAGRRYYFDNSTEYKALKRAIRQARSNRRHVKRFGLQRQTELAT